MNMRKLLFLLILANSVYCSAQYSSNVPPRYNVNPNALYQLFPTENRWIFIKHNIQTGQMWMIQYSTGNEDKTLTCPLNDTFADARRII